MADSIPRMKKSKNPNLGQELRELINYISPRRRYQLGFLLILIILSSFSELASLGAVLPFLGALSNASLLLGNPTLKKVLPFFNIQTSSQLVTILALLFVVVIILSTTIRILTINVQTRLAAAISSDLSCQVYNKTLLQSYEFHLLHNSSDLINSVTEDTRALTNAILIPLISGISTSFVSLTLVLGLFYIDKLVATFSIIGLGFSFLLIYSLRRKILIKNSTILINNSQEQIKIVQESLGGIRYVLLSGNQGFFESAYRNVDRPYRQAIASTTIISLTPRYLIEAMAMTAMAVFALSLGRDGDFSVAVPILGSLALGANRLLPALQQTFSSLVRIQGCRSSLKRILMRLQLEIDPLQSWNPQEILELEQELKFDNVWFRYSDDSQWVIKSLNLIIKARTTVGIVGGTGSGKSTISDLILGLIKPQQGLILVDGKPLNGERMRRWQGSIAHVPQSLFLSDASIAENIAFGIPKDKINLEQLYKSATLAQIDKFIQTLPNQYDTFVGERGVRLSGGQRQRIGIARALYSQASIIIFDEATSALDNETESEVMAAIESLRNKFTIILIAHRLTTLEKCDNIFELRPSGIVAHGSFKELISKSNFSLFDTTL